MSNFNLAESIGAGSRVFYCCGEGVVCKGEGDVCCGVGVGEVGDKPAPGVVAPPIPFERLVADRPMVPALPPPIMRSASGS
jgi:hypothetical protein